MLSQLCCQLYLFGKGPSIGGTVECDWSEWENEPSTLAGNNDNNNTDLAVKEHQSFSAMP